MLLNVLDQWNEFKKIIQTQRKKNQLNKKNVFYGSVGDIHSCRLGINIGYEENGKWCLYARPVLIIKKIGIMYFVVPMTTSEKHNIYHHILNNTQLNYHKSQTPVPVSTLILSQVRVVDASRFSHKIATVSLSEMSLIKEKLKTLLF